MIYNLTTFSVHADPVDINNGFEVLLDSEDIESHLLALQHKQRPCREKKQHVATKEDEEPSWSKLPWFETVCVESTAPPRKYRLSRAPYVPVVRSATDDQYNFWLPWPVWDYIFYRFLQHFDLGVCSMVCKSWNRMLKNVIGINTALVDQRNKELGIPISGRLMAAYTVALYGGDTRSFTESVELQLHCKDLQARERLYSQRVALPHNVRKNMKICVLGGDATFSEDDQQRWLDLGVDIYTMELLYNFKNGLTSHQKKGLINKYDVFVAHSDIIRRIPRMVGTAFNKRSKFPVLFSPNDDIDAMVSYLKRSFRIQLKRLGPNRRSFMGGMIGDLSLTPLQLIENLQAALAAVERWEPRAIQTAHLKTTMGRAFCLDENMQARYQLTRVAERAALPVSRNIYRGVYSYTPRSCVQHFPPVKEVPFYEKERKRKQLCSPQRKSKRKAAKKTAKLLSQQRKKDIRKM
eukprot:TRINITY_DN5257_c0_g1_i1.p1 TRINITY_DN5257_c0_g1~~TRINITY_DN5257_c0_g1_i1.p1  ORF type:complete len:464 (-),score=65.58 TRINITY_DN5257_c0_g1_i1:115-1506(-)